MKERSVTSGGRSLRNLAGATERLTARLKGERRLLERVYGRCQAVLAEACAYSSVPPEFLAALTANESGGDPLAARFEPGVYEHLKAVATGKAPVYAGIRASNLEAEIEEMLHPKAEQFHGRYLTPTFAAAYAQQIAALEDEALRELATSWGFTQIMGYHLVGRNGTVRDLREPRFHYRLAIELLSEFAEHYQVDLARELEEMFRCWNTGSPHGLTSDPEYAEKGLRRMEIYREITKGAEIVKSETAAAKATET